GRVVAGEGENMTMWSFAWTAPSAGRGALTLHVGMVDGNGAASALEPLNDPGGDDVAVAALRLCEGAPRCSEHAPPAPTSSRAAGCSAGAGSSSLLGTLALLGLRRRARRARPGRACAAVRLGALALSACFAPITPTDCPDHVCGGSDGGVASACNESWVCTSWEAPMGSD